MAPVFLRASRTALISCLLLWGPAAVAQANPAWVDPPVRPGDIAAPELAAPPEAARPPVQAAWESDRNTLSAQAAQALAVDYLDLWSAPNRVTLATASSFYGPTVTFHGRTRSLGSVLAEKRRFAERWPDRTYRHRPETTQVTCEADGARCTVRSSFDFAARNRRNGHRSLGIGEHELVVSFSGDRPVITFENSRVVRRGHGNLTSLLKEGIEFGAPLNLDKPRTRIRQDRSPEPLPEPRTP